MTFSELTDRPPDGASRGETVICVYGTGDGDRLEACLRALRVDADSGRRVLIAGERAGWAVTADIDEALGAAAPADVAILAADVAAGPGWLDGLRAAAAPDPRIGLVSASDPLAAAEEPDPTAAPPSSRCIFIRRTALELVGELDRSLPPDEALVDLTDRCFAHGMRHVVTDDVRLGDGSGSQAAPRSVTIDARCLGASLTGTAVATLDLIEALAVHTELRLRAVVLDEIDGLDPELRARFDGLGVELLPESEADDAPATDLVHRPYQAGSVDDLLLLGRLGRRQVVTQLDTIAYRTAAYFDSEEEWRGYRELTEVALGGADAVVFIGPDAAADAARLGLVREPRTTVIPLAVARPGGPLPAGGDGGPLPERPYLLCLGTDFTHKNRRFALRLLEALLEGGGFDGRLVLAGPHVDAGSSAEEEAEYLAVRPRLADRVLDLGPIEEVRKRRLLTGATAVVYPSTVEGFGLVPFEAAEVGVPALFAPVASLRDLFGDELALLVPWDAEASARAVAPVLVPGADRERLIDGIRAVSEPLTHAALARRHAELYDAVIAGPRAPGAEVFTRHAELLVAERALRGDVANYHRALSEIYQDPVRGGFVGPHAVVPEELQRATLALAMRAPLRDLAVALYRVVHRLLGRSR